MVTLLLSPLTDSQLFPASLSMPSLISRPTFPLVPSGSELEHVFPQTAELTSDAQHVWILDFTHGGQFPGVVVSQSRLREMELVVNPLSGMDSMSTGMMSFGTGSWVALLVRGVVSSSCIAECRISLTHQIRFRPKDIRRYT
jgi:hypothetical protein